MIMYFIFFVFIWHQQLFYAFSPFFFFSQYIDKLVKMLAYFWLVFFPKAIDIVSFVQLNQANY